MIGLIFVAHDTFRMVHFSLDPYRNPQKVADKVLKMHDKNSIHLPFILIEMDDKN